MTKSNYKLICYIPSSHFEVVKQHILDTGCGAIGDYSHCAWSVMGQGQFKPKENSQPFIGKQQQTSFVDEYRLETIGNHEQIKAGIASIRQYHPYEEPAFEVIELIDLSIFES